MFYEDDAFLQDKLVDYVRVALELDQAAVIVATEAHLGTLESRLNGRGFDLERAAQTNRYIRLVVDDLLERFMRNGEPDADRFFEIFEPIFARAGHGSRHPERKVSAFGELVAKLAAEGNSAAAVKLEDLWNQLGSRCSFDLLCAYPIASFSSEQDAAALSAICDLHTRVTPSESIAGLATDDERLVAITRLQQRALALEMELTRRIQSERESKQHVRAGQDQFVSVVAHELKTPLTTLRAYSQLLARDRRNGGVIDPQRLETAVGAIEFQTGKLTRLVSNVMETMAIDEGSLWIDPLDFDLAHLIRATLSAEFADARHDIAFNGPDTYVVHADPHRMRQVILNLLDNATKFSPLGSRISVELRRRDDSSTELSVRDEGAGITTDSSESIFERFSQAEGASHQSGIGLGLYVARHIMDLHGGTLRLDGTGPDGSRFVATLPRRPDRSPFETYSQSDDPPPRVLLVDDDASIRQLIELVLEDEGFVVEFAAEGQAALEIIRRQHPDLILLDMRMPGMDGWEFVERYRAYYGHRAPIIVFTAAHNAAERSAEVDADAYIAKPFDLDTLIEQVATLVKRNTGRG